MPGKLLYSVITPHSPRMAVEATAPPFLKGVIEGSHELGKTLRAAKPDLLIVHSTHWVCSFNWYVTSHERHRGHCVADEAPDLIPGLPYDRPGDPVFAEALLAKLKGANVPCGKNASPHYHWDYGSYVPLHYLDPEQKIPAVLVGTCLMSDLDECLRVGGLIRATVEETGRRAVFISSTALAHRIIRGPDQWPSAEHMENDRRFMDMIRKGEIKAAKRWLPDYAKAVVAEMGGRNVATMLGTIDDANPRLVGASYGAYGQSSGSGNVSLSVQEAA
jgi:aromatic ring-opening dioxygenase catalytic subunit (LigB family)